MKPIRIALKISNLLDYLDSKPKYLVSFNVVPFLVELLMECSRIQAALSLTVWGVMAYKLESRKWSCDTLSGGVAFMEKQRLECKQEYNDVEEQLIAP